MNQANRLPTNASGHPIETTTIRSVAGGCIDVAATAILIETGGMRSNALAYNWGPNVIYLGASDVADAGADDATPGAKTGVPFKVGSHMNLGSVEGLAYGKCKAGGTAKVSLIEGY